MLVQPGFQSPRASIQIRTHASLEHVVDYMHQPALSLKCWSTRRTLAATCILSATVSNSDCPMTPLHILRRHPLFSAHHKCLISSTCPHLQGLAEITQLPHLLRFPKGPATFRSLIRSSGSIHRLFGLLLWHRDRRPRAVATGTSCGRIHFFPDEQYSC